MVEGMWGFLLETVIRVPSFPLSWTGAFCLHRIGERRNS